MNKTRGFLLIDQKMNTVVLPLDHEDLIEYLGYKPHRPEVLHTLREHTTLKQLDADVRAYIRDAYMEELKNGGQT